MGNTVVCKAVSDPVFLSTEREMWEAVPSGLRLLSTAVLIPPLCGSASTLDFQDKNCPEKKRKPQALVMSSSGRGKSSAPHWSRTWVSGDGGNLWKKPFSLDKEK